MLTLIGGNLYSASLYDCCSWSTWFANGCCGSRKSLAALAVTTEAEGGWLEVAGWLTATDITGNWLLEVTIASCKTEFHVAEHDACVGATDVLRWLVETGAKYGTFGGGVGAKNLRTLCSSLTLAEDAVVRDIAEFTEAMTEL